MKTIVVALLAALVPACAGDPPPPAATPATEPAAPPATPSPRSSIAAVVQHRGELGLTDDQIETMEKRDREREEEDRALRAEDEKRRKAAEEAARNAPGPAPSARAPGGGMRGGGMGMRGGGMGGPPPGGHFAAKPRGESLEDRLDANDTKAYLDIEDVLTPAQRDPAREIASDYRAQLYDRREQQGQSRK